MAGKRCPVCDGPVANGRCKLCGMPYRKDEILYHLNEDRSDHYKHATPMARAIMRQEEIPLGDKKPPRKAAPAKKAYSSAASSRSAQASSDTFSGNRAMKARNTPKDIKRSSSGRIGLLIILMAGLLWNLFSVREERLQVQSISERSASDTATDSFTLEKGIPLIVGSDFPPGRYIFFSDDGLVSFQIRNNGHPRRYVVSEEEGLPLELTDGDIIILNPSDDTDYLRIIAE